MMKKLVLLCFLACSCLLSSASTQGDTAQLAKQKKVGETTVVDAFRFSRLIYGRSAQTTKGGYLDIVISGRFGPVTQGFHGWFGLDSAFTRIGVDYGITERLMVGFGRSKMEKEFDVNMAYKILQQSTGLRNMPLTLTVYGAVMINSQKMKGVKFYDRLSTVLQVSVARQFIDRISVQVSPVWVYSAVTPDPGNVHHIFSVGLGGSVKVSKNISINAEYYPLFSGLKYSGTTSPLAIGVDIQTRGHVFQFFVGNSMAPNEHLLLTHTTDKWLKGKLHLGFTLKRSFGIAPQKK